MNTTIAIDIYGSYNPGWGLGVKAGGRWLAPRKPKPHKGSDWTLATPGTSAGTPVIAAVAGVVVAAGGGSSPRPNGKGYGKWVQIQTELPDGTTLLETYGHVVGTVTVGQSVVAGQVIGHIGSEAELLAGWSQADIDGHVALGSGFTNPHLHNAVALKIPGSSKFVLTDPAFSDWQGFPHAIGTDVSGNGLVAQTVNGLTNCKAVDTTGALIAGTASSNSDLPAGVTITYASANPGTQYWEVDYGSQTGRLYDNGVQYAKDYQTAQEEWAVPTSTGGETDVIKFGNGVIVTKTYAADGSIDAIEPGTITLDASASADIKAAYDAWKAKGGDPSNIPGANIFLDQTLGGTASLLDARKYDAAGNEISGNAVLIGEGTFDGKGGKRIKGVSIAIKFSKSCHVAHALN